MAFKIRVTVRDGRTGREGGPAGVTPNGKGAILHVFEKDPPPLDEGQVLLLGDGTKVMVIGSEEQIAVGQYYEQTVYVGNIPEVSAGEAEGGHPGSQQRPSGSH